MFYKNFKTVTYCVAGWQTLKPLYVKENPRAASAGSETSANTENCESVFYGRVTPGEFDFFEIKE